MEKQFESARAFSKEMRAEERKQAADIVRTQRKEYFSRKGDLQKQLQELLVDAEAKKLKATEVRKNIETAESQITQKSQKFLSRLLEKRKIKQLQSEMGTQKADEAVIIQELADLEAAKLQLEQSLQGKSALDKARSELDGFYQKTEQDWNDYEDDRDAGNVKNIMRERGAFMVHAFINPTLSPSDENGLMKKELSWRDKLDLLALEPTISASAVDKNHTKTFASVGVLLGEGQVAAASRGDMGTKTIDQRTRTGPDLVNFKERIRDQISEALTEPGQGWTEFVVDNPKIAGLFFRLDSDDVESGVEDIRFRSDASISEVAQTAKERNLPLFVLKDGQFYGISPEQALALDAPKTTEYTYRVGLNHHTKKRIEYPKLDLRDEQLLNADKALDLPSGFSDKEKEVILERLMSDSPFQLKRFPEALRVLSRAEGRSFYHLYSQQHKESKGEKVLIPRYAAGNTNPIEVTLLKTIPGPTYLENCVRMNDGSTAIWRQSRKPVSEESRYRAGSTYQQDRIVDRGYGLNVAGMFISGKGMGNIREIISAIDDQKNELAGYIKEYEARGESYYASRYMEWNKNLASFLYGIAEEADGAGDKDTAELAKKVAGKVMPIEEYQDIVARRVSESGTFNITRQELLGEELSQT